MNRNNDTRTGSGKQRGYRWGITAKLVVSFSALFLVVLAAIELVNLYGVLFTSYEGVVGQETSEAFEKLNMVANIKKNRLARWIKERRADITVFAGNDFVRGAVSRLHTDMHKYKIIKKTKDYEALREYLGLIMKAYGSYDRIWIACSDRKTVLISTDESDQGEGVSGLSYFSNALEAGGAYASDITKHPKTGLATMHFSTTIKDANDEAIAVMVMDSDPTEILQSLLHTGEGLGDKGEALLINRNAKILVPLKHPLADGTIAAPLIYRIRSKPARLAAAGQEGIIESVDYRGEPVLAAYRYIQVSPDVGWGIVVKIDKDELVSFIWKNIKYTLVTSIAGMIAIVTLIIIFVKKFTGPIVSLSQVAQKVASGDLKARATVTSKDEIGALAAAFNEMVTQVQNWRGHLEETVGKRTSKLQAEIFERAKVDRELKRHRDHLEEMVKEKTKELDEKVVKLDRGQKAMLYMVEDLNATRKDLKKSHDELEARVEVRTSELQAEIIERNLVEEERERAFKELDFTHKQFIKSQIRLIQSEKMNAIGTLVAGVAHELNNPMMGILNYIQYCRKHTPSEDKRYEVLENAESEVKRCVDIVDNLLTFSHLEKEGVEEQSKAAYPAVLERVFKLIEYRTKRERVVVDKRYEPELPEMLMRENRIQQVFLNLMNNALDAMKGSEKKEITVEVRREKDYIVVSIVDTGSGIAPEDLEHIFEPFFTTKSAGKGTGLGLSVTRTIVEDEGGTISCESKPGEGTKFTVNLPIDERRETRDERRETRDERRRAQRQKAK